MFGNAEERNPDRGNWGSNLAVCSAQQRQTVAYDLLAISTALETYVEQNVYSRSLNATLPIMRVLCKQTE